MTPEHWAQIDQIFHSIRERPEEREVLLAEADPEVRREVESLLAQDPLDLMNSRVLFQSARLSPGTQIGPYRIASLLGFGGMGEVYRATDTQLGREVAIKVLPSSPLSSPQRLARLEREARLLAALNHPHIAAIYALEHVGPAEALVLELVSGEALNVRLARGPLAVAEALTYARQIAEALEAAHGKGIIHRDLKPANIQITPEGIVKVLDFGLAKVQAPHETGSRAQTVSDPAPHHTRTGMILGTAAYMSPEQARGQVVDKRTDIWAFGVVLYEMLAGKPAFSGPSVPDVLSAILHRDPDWHALPPEVPTAIRRLLQHCLEQDPNRRLHDIADARIEIEDSLAPPASAVAPHPDSPVSRTSRWLPAVTSLLAAALLGTWGWQFYLSANLAHSTSPGLRFTRWMGASAETEHAPGPVVRAVILSPPEQRFESIGDASGPPVISPDGTRVVFAARGSEGQNLWVRPFNSEAAQLLADTTDGSFPFWSPDSKFIAFFANGYLKRVPADGGPVSNIVPIENARGGTWGPDNTIIYTPRFRDGLYLVNAAGGSPRRLTAPETTGHTSHRWPSFLPDGKHFLYYAGHHENLNSPSNGVYLGSVDGRVNKLVLPSRTQAQYASGYLLYDAGATLLAQRFQPATGELDRDPVTLATGVQMDPMIWRANFSASDAGPLVYQSGAAGGGSDLLWYDRNGKIVGRIGKRDHYGDFSLSSDKERLVVSLGDPEPDLWRLDVSSGRSTRLTFGDGSHTSPVWSPDGRRIAFAWRREVPGQGHFGLSLYVRGVSGTEPPEKIIEAPAGSSALPLAWSPDGKYIAYFDQSGPKARVSVVPLFGDRKPRVVAEESVGQASLSPDGRWIAYDTNIGGKMEVFVTAFPRGQGRWQVSQNGGVAPFWSDAGNELFFLGSNNMLHVAAVESLGQEFRVRDDRLLFQARAAGITQPFRVSQKGQRILVNTVPMDPAVPFTVVANWTSLLSGR